MTPTHSLPYKMLVVFFGLLFIVAVGLLAWAMKDTPSVTYPMSTVAPTTTVTTGTLTCLPHRQTSGPVTQECALGLKVDNATYEALDTSLYPSDVTAFTVGQMLKVTGTVLPVSEITDKTVTQTYAIAGIIKVADIEPSSR